MSDALRLGTRASALARWQADWVATRLQEDGRAVELVPVTTRGDLQQSGPIAAVSGGDGAFTKELQRALLAEQVDLAVHSLKDLPTEPVAGLLIGSVPRRGPVGDVLVTRDGRAWAELPQGAKVGTGSLRRRAQLLHARPDLRIEGVRGNVETRLAKLEAGEYDALVLAEAGLQRLNLAQDRVRVFDKDVLLPSVGQGALGIEIRAADDRAALAVKPLDDPATHAAVTAERTMLRAIGGGCLAPIGAWAQTTDDHRLELQAVVLSTDGRQRLSARLAGDVAQAIELGQAVARDLLAQGAAELVAAARTG